MSEALRKGREGSRWFNERPTPEDVATWFKTVPLHEGMDHERYIGGIVLIEQKMKTDEIVGYDERGVPKIIEDVSHLTFTPYPKVETRVQYFTDLMSKHPDWLGLIEPVGEPVNGLPPGYRTRAIAAGQKSATFVYCTMRVRVYERESFEESTTRVGRDNALQTIRSGKTIIDAPPATKMVALIDRWGKPDPFSMMKAETGAVGRALGMAGMLVVPGAGVATADDMHEVADARPGLQTAEEAAPPPEAKPQPEADAAEEPSEDEMRQRASNAIAALREDHPDAYVPFKAWADERGIAGLGEVKGPALKGLVRKAEKALDAAKNTAPVHEPDPDAG